MSLGRAPFAMLTGLAFVVGCSSNSSTPGTSPTATPVGSHTATPTPVAVGPTPTPTPTTGGGTIACNAPTAALPGTYLSVFTEGLTSGSTYVQDPAADYGVWSVDTYTAVTATPTPTPVATATPVPTPTPTPLMYSVFYGTSTTTAFTTAGTSVPAQTECFFFEVIQPVGGTIAQFRGSVPRAAATATADPNDNSVGLGEPNISEDATTTNVATGALTAFTLTNLSLSRGTGSGAFTLDSGATGTVTIQGAASVVELLPPGVRRAYLRMHAMRSAILERH